MFVAIVPSYNEEQTIGSVVQSLFYHVHQVVVVDDGSADRTSVLAKESGAIVLRHALNRGQGAALETGHEYARVSGADYVLHFDGDGQFDSADITPALAYLKDTSADILFGSRFLDSRSRVPWFKRYLWLPLGRRFDRLVHRTDLTDAHNGFRILTRRALNKIRLTHDRMAHASEIVGLAKQHQLKLVEFPVKVVYREYGQGLAGGLKIVRDLVVGKFLKN